MRVDNKVIRRALYVVASATLALAVPILMSVWGKYSDIVSAAIAMYWGTLIYLEVANQRLTHLDD